MYKLVVITKSENIAVSYANEMRRFFEDALQIDWKVDTDGDMKAIYDYDMVLLSTYSILATIKPYLNPHSKVVKIIKNIQPEGLHKLDQVSYGAEALVVNVGAKTAAESIHLIYSHGRTDLDLFPYYPGIPEYKKRDIVITQGEQNIYPHPCRQFIDIYNTVIDAQIFLEIILYFNLPKSEYIKKLMEMNCVRGRNNEGFSYMISEKYLLDNVISMLFENLNEGLIIFDAAGEITSCSASAQQMLNMSGHNIIGRQVFEVLPLDRKAGANQNIEAVIKIGKNMLICSLISNLSIGIRDVGLIILKKYSEAQAKMHAYRKELMQKGYRTKYDFSDIIGSSEVMANLRDIAVRMAKSESTVLITGESGTGKELFAHAIHQNSYRFDRQFVAINCASIPESLLESELFGYADGAFTGALKGGKRGIFEMADGGTLFLDEISEIPFHLQNRLLRVINEKEFTRVGGDQVLPANVRIIAATNQNLKNQVEAGKFRKDLYYRLSVLMLRLPPLREREGDLFELFESLCGHFGARLMLTDEAKACMREYEWDGNIRELKNCVEYLVNLGKATIDRKDLPETIRQCPPPAPREDDGPDLTRLGILKILQAHQAGLEKIGRKRISEQLVEYGVFLGEQEVRKHLLKMEQEGLIRISRGRGGTSITQKGMESLRNS